MCIRDRDGMVNGLVVAALKLADRDDHIQFARAEAGEGLSLIHI